jgi:tol-pal system protein YbgF
LRGELADVQKRLEAEQRRTAAAEKKVDELENRVFLLTDQVESQKVAAIHRGARPLPVVTLKPETATTNDANMPGEEIVFEGAARSSDPDHARPTYRIEGNTTRTVSHRTSEPAASPSPPPVASAGGSDNLGVAPAPPIRSSTTMSSSPAPAAPPPSEHAAPAAEPMTLYRTAYDDLRAGRHDAAEKGFRDFVRRFPHHDLADNAQYWLGECFYDQKRFDKAAPEFRVVVQRWPTGNKAPDAMLKLGFSLIAMGEADKGRAALRELPATYPRTEAARLASERLASLPMEGTK